MFKLYGVATGDALVQVKTFVCGYVRATDTPEFYTNSLANVPPVSGFELEPQPSREFRHACPDFSCGLRP